MGLYFAPGAAALSRIVRRRLAPLEQVNNREEDRSGVDYWPSSQGQVPVLGSTTASA
jgi:hypothetical protein